MDILRQRAVWTMGGMKKKKGKKIKGEKKNENAENGDCSSRVAGTDAGGIIQIVSVFQVAVSTTALNDDDGDTSTVDKVTYWIHPDMLYSIQRGSGIVMAQI